jgi:site-specific DNA recombinase
MESAYIYVRVSTDEQKRKGYSLVEQEDRLLKYCIENNIQVKGVFREDFSAKDFNRPEWKKLVKTLRRNKHRAAENVLFLKWDRFSRNIEFAYQMIGILKELNTLAMAIDQPIDFEVPESIVMLAVYLSIPEAENSRRGKNTSDGIRRAKKMGRWPGRAPIGYSNQTGSDGRHFIAPKQPEADLVKWSFQQFSRGLYSISQVGRMACINGLKCGRNNFWKLLRNPIYCGLIMIPPTKTEDIQFVKAAHEPLISESLFKDVQLLLGSRRRHYGKREDLKYLFPLRGFLDCPYCGRKLTGSISQGNTAKHRYYHCATSRCKGRFRADVLDTTYEDRLSEMDFLPEALELVELVLQDENVLSARQEHLNERKALTDEMAKQESLMSKARNLLLVDKIDFNDFSEIKGEYKLVMEGLRDRLLHVDKKLSAQKGGVDDLPSNRHCTIFQAYENQDVAGKRQIINLLSPTSIDTVSRTFGSLRLNHALTKIIRVSKKTDSLV